LSLIQVHFAVIIMHSTRAIQIQSQCQDTAEMKTIHVLNGTTWNMKRERIPNVLISRLLLGGLKVSFF